MKSYEIDTELHFGKYEGKTLKDVVLADSSYVEWCILNLDHFVISDESIEDIKKLMPTFVLTPEADEVRKIRAEDYESKMEQRSHDAMLEDMSDYDAFEGDDWARLSRE